MPALIILEIVFVKFLTRMCVCNDIRMATTQGTANSNLFKQLVS